MLLKYNVAIFKRVATHIWRYPSCSKVPTEFSPPPSPDHVNTSMY